MAESGRVFADLADGPPLVSDLDVRKSSPYWLSRSVEERLGPALLDQPVPRVYIVAPSRGRRALRFSRTSLITTA